MYEDDLWYRRFTKVVEDHKSAFSEKQVKRYQLTLLLRIAGRVKDFSDQCETCRSYQRTLTRLKEEMPELPGSRAQRQYQAQQLREMGEHFVNAHNLAPPGYYMRKWLIYGLIAGAALGVILGMVILGSALYLPAGAAIGVLVGGMIGNVMDGNVKQGHRLI